MNNFELVDIPEFDYMNTKREVYKVIKNYKRAMNKLYLNSNPKITANYSIVPPSRTNQFHSSTERAALYSLDQGEKFAKYVEYVDKAMNSLSEKYRVIVYRCFFKNESDTKVGMDLNYSESSIRDLRKEALELFSYALKVDKHK